VARTKGIAYRSPLVLDFRITESPRDIANLSASAASAPDFAKRIVSVTDIHKKFIPTDMITTHKSEIRKKELSDLAKAGGIIDAYQVNQHVSKEALAWAIEIGEKEQTREDAKNVKLAADGATGMKAFEQHRSMF
jgi:hypothetical protein